MSPKFSKRTYSWNSFTFPACGDCNARWSSREGEIKPIIQRLLDSSAISADELSKLLDWFDKVRIGLWLGMLYLNKNYQGVRPKFFIDNRVGKQDRALFVFESQERYRGLTLSGADNPVFHVSPGVCLVGINHLQFITISGEFLLAKRMGWPFASTHQLIDFDTQMVSVEMAVGSQVLAPPVLTYSPAICGGEIIQPIAPQNVRSADPDFIREFYRDRYIIDMCKVPEEGIGKVFFSNQNPTPYPVTPSQDWRPTVQYGFQPLVWRLALWVARAQRKLYEDQMPDISPLSDVERARIVSQREANLKVQDAIIRRIESSYMAAYG